jgi:transposase
MTITDLYRDITGDVGAHPRTISANFKRLDTRRRGMIQFRADGRSWREIAAIYQVSHGSVASAVRGGLRAIRKTISGAPRYTNGRSQKAKAAASSVATPTSANQLAHGRTR